MADLLDRAFCDVKPVGSWRMAVGNGNIAVPLPPDRRASPVISRPPVRVTRAGAGSPGLGPVPVRGVDVL